MPKTKEKIAKVLKNHSFAVFATITEDGKPWARYVSVNSEDDFTVWFGCHKSSRKVAQIKKNPEIHLTLGVDSVNEMDSYLQIQGKAQLVTDAKILHEKWKEDFSHYFKGPDDPEYVIISIKPYRIEFVTMQGTEAWEQ
ncbi:MAG: pyridoxamine 5'-phosphate oxidase family protein [Candidatus Ozemobacteraceae bacterium]